MPIPRGCISPLSGDVFYHFCRDLVHRQTACWAVKHMALGVYGFGCDDALMHLFNLVWPNIFENSPHMVQAFMDAVDGCRVALGPTIVLQYTLQVNLIIDVGQITLNFLFFIGFISSGSKSERSLLENLQHVVYRLTGIIG